MKKLMLCLMGVMIFLFLVACTPKEQAFDKSKVLAQSAAQAGPILEKDFDTDAAQVRHLSWGKLNYYPETITVVAGKKVQIMGDTKRLQGCFRTISIPQFKVNGQFTEQNNMVEFTPTEKGEFGFGCAMGMGKGTLIVE